MCLSLCAAASAKPRWWRALRRRPYPARRPRLAWPGQVAVIWRHRGESGDAAVEYGLYRNVAAVTAGVDSAPLIAVVEVLDTDDSSRSGRPVTDTSVRVIHCNAGPRTCGLAPRLRFRPRRACRLPCSVVGSSKSFPNVPLR